MIRILLFRVSIIVSMERLPARSPRTGRVRQVRSRQVRLIRSRIAPIYTGFCRGRLRNDWMERIENVGNCLRCEQYKCEILRGKIGVWRFFDHDLFAVLWRTSEFIAVMIF